MIASRQLRAVNSATLLSLKSSAGCLRLHSGVYKSQFSLLLRERGSTRRSLSTSSSQLMPYESFRRKSLLSSVTSWIPAPVKTFGAIAGGTALIFFVATPLIIIFTPPLAIAAWILFRNYKRRERQLFEQRWSNMGSYHLAYDSNILTDQVPPRAVKNTVFNAIENNEQNLRQVLKVSDPSQIHFSPVEAIFQDFRASPSGLEESMQVVTYGLVSKNTNQRIAKVNVVVTSGANKKMRVELMVGSKMYVLDGDSSEDNIIEVKPLNVRKE